MGQFVPLANGAQVELIFLLGGKNVENRLWFTFDNPPFGGTELQGLSDGVAAWHVANILPFLSQDITLATVIATDWTSSPAPAFTSTSVSIAGGVADGSHSANVSVVVPFRWPIGFYHLKRNKNYVPGIPKSGLDGNVVTSSLQDDLFEGYAALIDATRLFSPAFNWRWVVTSAYEAGAPRSEQFALSSQGPSATNTLVPSRKFVIGQRRPRLPE